MYIYIYIYIYINICRLIRSPIPIPINLFKAIFFIIYINFLSCRIIHSDTPNSIFRYLFSAWISFVKMGGISFLADSCERGFFFFFEGWRGIFQKYTFKYTFMFDNLVHFYIYNCATITLISNPNIVTENAFSLWFVYSNTIFIDVFKCNTYTKHIIQCVFILLLGYI